MNKVKNLTHSQESPFKGVLLAYFIVLFHVVLIFVLGVLMLFFRSIVNFLPWIIASGGVIIVISWYLWWHRVKKRGKKLSDSLKDPVFQGRSVEVTLLGGIASLKLGQPQRPTAIDYTVSDEPKQLVDPAIVRAQELNKLAHLLKEDLITMDEFINAKKDLMG